MVIICALVLVAPWLSVWCSNVFYFSLVLLFLFQRIVVAVTIHIEVDNNVYAHEFGHLIGYVS
jgi:hypothetical protein